MPEHPDREQLAAFQAGDGDRRQRADVAAHLDGCPSCAAVVASVERARRALAVLEEPEVPPGLHDRLTAAVDAEAARALPHRPAPWYRRPAAWGAAAALLLAALVVPLLGRTDRELASTTAGGGGGGAGEAAQAPGGPSGTGLPVIRLPGEVSAATVRATLANDPLARQALDRATATARSLGRDTAARRAPTADSPTQESGGQQDAYRAGSPRATPASPQACLAAATTAADPATRPLVPAFYVEGTYQGREATILVTTSTTQPGRTDLWVFPRSTCSSPPLDSQRVR